MSQLKELNRPSWEDIFFEIAKAIAKRSSDTHTKVGAVIAKDNHILSVGYNDIPENYDGCFGFDWNTSEKYKYVIHAEMNAISNAHLAGININNASIYLTLSPCCECIKLLIQFKIREIHYIEEYKDFDEMMKIANRYQIDVIKYKK